MVAAAAEVVAEVAEAEVEEAAEVEVAGLLSGRSSRAIR